MKKIMVLSLLILLPLAIWGADLDLSAISSKLARAFISDSRGMWVPTQITSNDVYGSVYDPYMRIVLDYGTQLTMPDSISIFEYDSSAEEWVKLAVNRYQYNAQGRIVQGIMYYNTGYMYVPGVRITSTYNNQDWLTHMYVDFFSFVDQTWSPSTRFHVLYDGPQIENIYTWSWDSSSGVDSYSKINMLFDTQGRIIEEIDQVSADSTSWINDYRLVRSYHSSDTSTNLTFIHHISQYLPLMFAFEDVDMLDPSKPLEETEYNWMRLGWMENERNEYSYNAEDLCSMQTLSWWDLDHWVEVVRFTNLYYYFEEIFQEFTWEWDNGNWVNTMMDQYEWTFVDVANADPVLPGPGEMALRLYPTPFSGKLNISLRSQGQDPVRVQIYNLKGQKIREWNCAGCQTTEWDGLDAAGNEAGAGIYLVKASSGRDFQTAKCLKLK
ncbi:MAG: T9SS type A sorting domain-containing protein [Candidatus Syntrophosphaera sp.]|nr:T9SS type A sorting domain-containing protein [Candidatus Syntrophosphaera sp.]